MRKLPLGFTVAGLTAALMILSACGSSSSSHGTTGKDSGVDTGTVVDSGTPDSTVTDTGMIGSDTGTDAEPDSTPPGDSSNDAPPPDAGDGSTGPCNFATEVKALIANDTTSSAVPVPISTFNGCTDDMNQADYPPSFF